MARDQGKTISCAYGSERDYPALPAFPSKNSMFDCRFIIFAKAENKGIPIGSADDRNRECDIS